MTDDYRLLDTGDEQKLEQVGPVRVVRQATQAHWPRALPTAQWDRVDAVHHRAKTGGGHWQHLQPTGEQWVVRQGPLQFSVKLTDFGHIGLFPEQADNWTWIEDTCRALGTPNVINLFGYTGGSTLAAARGGAAVTHVDASKGVVSWGRDNAALNDLDKAPIRWIVEDVSKYIERERKRGNRYQGLILDPPSFGRGPRGQVWKIESHLIPFFQQIAPLMAPLSFVLLSCHTPGYSPISLANILHRVFGLPPGAIEAGEMTVPVADTDMVLPSGTFARWRS